MRPSASRKATVASARATAVAPRAISIAGLVDHCALLDPRHHGAQLGANLLDRMGGAFGAHRLERGLVDAVLQHPVTRELARLDVGKDALHFLLGLFRDDARP